MIELNGPSLIRAKDVAKANHYGVIFVVEQATPRIGATIIPTGLEGSLSPSTTFGVILVTVRDTPLILAMPPPLKFHRREKGKTRAIKASRVTDNGRVKIFLLLTTPSKQHQPFTMNRLPPRSNPGGTTTS
jgi:hypothetical protein